jgi:hypothetical protein
MTTKTPLQKILQGILYTEKEKKKKPQKDRQYWSKEKAKK